MYSATNRRSSELIGPRKFIIVTRPEPSSCGGQDGFGPPKPPALPR
jgi:hypothetical protein